MSEANDGNGTVKDAGGPPTAEPGPRGTHPEAFARSGAEPPPDAPPKKPFYKRPLPMIIIGLVVLAAVVIGLLLYLHSRDWESTDDAFVQADVTQVSPRVAGHVMKVAVTDNQSVEQGALLVQLDPADFQAKVNEMQAALDAAKGNEQQAVDNAAVAEANVGSTQAAQRSAQTEADRAHNELHRYESLSAQAVTQQQLINLGATARSADAQLESAKQKTVSAQAQVKFAQSQILAAKAQVEQAAAALKQAALQLEYTVIHAPIAGNVTSRSVQTGDYVQVGQALLALVPKDVYVIANFKETQLAEMRPGQEVEFTVDAFPGHTFHGRVDSIQRGTGAAFSLLPPENATGNYVKVVQRVPVKITFPADPNYHLGVGMSVVPKVKVR